MRQDRISFVAHCLDLIQFFEECVLLLCWQLVSRCSLLILNRFQQVDVSRLLLKEVQDGLMSKSSLMLSLIYLLCGYFLVLVSLFPFMIELFLRRQQKHIFSLKL